MFIRVYGLFLVIPKWLNNESVVGMNVSATKSERASISSTPRRTSPYRLNDDQNLCHIYSRVEIPAGLCFGDLVVVGAA
jgi:cell division FtsZ-interacting protein ZapD